MVNFHFFHYKSKENMISSYLTGIKNTIYVDANVLSMYAKLQLHPAYGF